MQEMKNRTNFRDDRQRCRCTKNKDTVGAACAPRSGVTVLRSLLWLYKHTFSLFFGNRCRFFPPCSDYATEALEEHGLVNGGLLAIKRIAKCHPWHEGGFDYVPSKSEVDTKDKITS